MLTRAFIFLAILLCLCETGIAQRLYAVPDTTLRRALARHEMLTRDSLDVTRDRARSCSRSGLSLTIYGGPISTFSGLQYLTALRYLAIKNCQVDNFDALPDSIEALYCEQVHFKGITRLPRSLRRLVLEDIKGLELSDLPQGLEVIRIKRTDLSVLPALPTGLTELDVAQNRLLVLPPLPASLHYLNYSSNLITGTTLPQALQYLPCTRQDQNCLPFEQTGFKVLDTKWKPGIGPIVRIKMRYGYASDSSWAGSGVAKEIDVSEIREFKLKRGRFVSHVLHHTEAEPFSPPQFLAWKGVDRRHKTYFTHKSRATIDTTAINHFLADAVAGALAFSIPAGGTVDLRGKPSCSVSYGSGCYVGYHPSPGYCIVFYSDRDSIITSSVRNAGIMDVLRPADDACQNLPHILNWLYAYRLMQIIYPSRSVSQEDKNILYGLLTWAMSH